MEESRKPKNENRKMVWRFYQSGIFKTFEKSWIGCFSLSDCLHDTDDMKIQVPPTFIDKNIRSVIKILNEKKG